MLKYFFGIIKIFFGFFFFLFWNKTTYLLLLLFILGVLVYIACHRIHFSFKREKVGGKKTVLITGGSGGIGFGFAKLFVEDEYNVIILARNEQKLEKSRLELEKMSNGGQKILAWSFDLAKDESPKEIFEKLKDEDIEIDILVNNAAVSSLGYFIELEENYTKMIMANCASLVNLTRLILQGMIKRDYGLIMNVSSLAGMTPTPCSSVYAATKSFVQSFSLSLNCELSEYKNVSSSLLYPGWTDTDLADGTLEKYKLTREEFMKIAGGGMKLQSADECAFEGYRGLMKRFPETISGDKNFFIGKVLWSFLPTFKVMQMKKGMLSPLFGKKIKNN